MKTKSLPKKNKATNSIQDISIMLCNVTYYSLDMPYQQSGPIYTNKRLVNTKLWKASSKYEVKFCLISK